MNDFVLPILTSLFCGTLIGVEREYKQKDAGLKTSALICVGAALFTLMGVQVFDAGRVISQIVSGVGFVGGGAIILDRNKVKGLNSAAIIWICAAIGCLCALNMYFEAVFTSVMIIIIEVLENGFKRVIEKFRK